MTKKDYILIAGVFKKAVNMDYLTRDESVVVESLYLELAKVLKKDNPLFDKEKFINYINK